MKSEASFYLFHSLEACFEKSQAACSSVIEILNRTHSPRDNIVR